MLYFRLSVLFILGIMLVPAQTAKIKPVPVKLSATTDGAQLYREHCAVCHGVEAKGNGPAAEALKRRPTDLTQLAAKNGGKYPGLAVQQKIKGGEVIEHGTVEMPIWGRLLVGPGRAKTDADIRIYALTAYLEKIQAK